MPNFRCIKYCPGVYLTLNTPPSKIRQCADELAGSATRALSTKNGRLPRFGGTYRLRALFILLLYIFFNSNRGDKVNAVILIPEFSPRTPFTNSDVASRFPSRSRRSAVRLRRFVNSLRAEVFSRVLRFAPPSPVKLRDNIVTLQRRVYECLYL